jgi:hypothetical protein
MLILCTGPDTYRARQKAAELEQAFRAKFDPSGYATLNDPTLPPEALALQLGTTSLFAQRKFFRRDRLIVDASASALKTLVKQLSGDQESLIVVSVEDGPLDTKASKALDGLKVVAYPYPALERGPFEAWCVDEAKKKGVSSEMARRISSTVEVGDTWLASQEMDKASANPDAPLLGKEEKEAGVFVVADAFVGGQSWRSLSAHLEDSPLAVFSSQVRSAIRVRDGAIQGVHPFLVKKLSQLRPRGMDVVERLHRLLRAQTAQRQYLSQEDEMDALL